MNGCLLPLITFGSETWNLTKTLTVKYKYTQRAHERIMMRLTWQDKQNCRIDLEVK